MDIERLKEFAKLTTQKEEFKIELNRIQQRLKDLDEPIQDMLLDNGIDRITIDGRTIFIRSDVWAKVLSSKEEVVTALREAELDEYVVTGFNTQSISAYIREQLASGEPLPKALNGHLTSTEVLSVRSTKA